MCMKLQQNFNLKFLGLLWVKRPQYLTFMIGSDLVPVRVDDFVDAVEETVDAETVDDDTDTNN